MCGIYKILRWSAWATVQRKIKYEIYAQLSAGIARAPLCVNFSNPNVTVTVVVIFPDHKQVAIRKA